MGDRLDGQVALVTGASRGIGRAIALELASRGAAVAVNYRARYTDAESVAIRIREMGRPCILVQGDVAVSEEARGVVRRVLEEWGRLDILVNNAGITRNRSSRKPADGEWVDVINVNLNGTFYCTSAAIDRMVSQKHGHIINIFSMQGQTAASAPASNKGLIAFTRTVALETAKYGITANAVSPGYTATEMFDALPENLKNQIQAKIPAGRFCKPEEVACAVAFLASEADYITGQQISVSGGVCM